MASKGKPKATTVKRDPNTLVAKPNKERAAVLAQVAVQPSIKGAVTIKEYVKEDGDLDLMRLVDELSDQEKAVNDGNLKHAEGMLMVQAHTLDAIFNSLVTNRKIETKEKAYEHDQASSSDFSLGIMRGCPGV